MKTAIITGITGQDGSYLAELLLSKGYKVYAIMRRSSTFTTDRIEHLRLHENIKIIFGDVGDASISELIYEVKPDEFYNLAAQSHVRVSFDVPEYTADITGVGTLRVLEAIRRHSSHTKFYQASSSEMYGKVQEIPQTERTPFYPRSPYGCAKVFAYWISVNYRESYNLFICNGILFNHESPRRGATFVTRKITAAVANWSVGNTHPLILGNLDAKRDWGYAPEYVDAMWRMLQEERPDDYVIATGETHSVREFVEGAFAEIGRKIAWRGNGIDEKGYDVKTGELLVALDARYHRPAEVDLLVGDATKAKEKLNWEAKVRCQELIKIMVAADIAALKEGAYYKYR